MTEVYHAGPATAADRALIHDLHSHSRASDGLLEPAALVERAARAGVDCLALTDHDTTAGVDEAGRGPWAGPVCAAAVVLDPDDLPEGVDDSKRLSPARRAAVLAQLRARARIGHRGHDVEIREVAVADVVLGAAQTVAVAVAPGTGGDAGGATRARCPSPRRRSRRRKPATRSCAIWRWSTPDMGGSATWDMESPSMSAPSNAWG